MPDLTRERRIAGPVAGVDEAGRGPLAGPVLAAALVFRDAKLPRTLEGLIDDSKKLSAAARARAFDEIRAQKLVGTLDFAIAAASVAEIDARNILAATHLAMTRALARLRVRPAHALIDGNRAPKGLALAHTCVVGGDARSLSIAAASICAKVVRDRIMARLDARYPHYGWASNKGYGAKAHIESLVVHGPSPHHRLSFAPLAQGRLSL
ncbi:MAG: ribonuclease HII [Azospirillum sp.]|nr:ribonuclease HII [Azospirillum sp.]